MKNRKHLIFLLTLILVSTIGFLIGQSNGFIFKKTSNIIFEKSIHDFGEIPRGKEVKYYFKYKNSGPNDLIFKDIIARCGCTVANWNKKPLSKGKLDSLAVHFDAEILGFFSKEILVFCNNENGPEKIYITGIVK